MRRTENECKQTESWSVHPLGLGTELPFQCVYGKVDGVPWRRHSSNVLFVNPYCADPNAESRAAGAAACFRSGSIQTDRLAGSPGTLLVQVD